MELCSKGYKRLPFEPAISLLGLYPKEIIGKMTCTKIFITALFVVAKNWKMREHPSIGEWLNKLWYLLVMEYYCTQRNNELEKFHVNCYYLQELMQSERSRTRRILNTETVVQSNIMEFSTISNAVIQNNAEGLMRKKAIHIQRKNCGSRNTEEKQLLETHGFMGILLGI